MDPLSEFPDDAIEIIIYNKKIQGSLDFSRFTKLQYLNCNCN